MKKLLSLAVLAGFLGVGTASARQAILSAFTGTVEIQGAKSSFWRKATPKIFLKEGDKVKAIVAFRGREISHSELCRRLLDRLIEDVGDTGIVEFRPRMEGFAVHAIFAPKK